MLKKGKIRSVKRFFTVFTVIALLFVLAACSSSSNNNTSSKSNTSTGDTSGDNQAQVERTKVTVILDWIVNAYHAPILIAIDKGYYDELGLDVEWSPGQGSFNAIQVAGSGAADFAMADAGTAVMAKAENDIPVTSVAAILQDTPSVIVAAPDITTPQELEGRSIATVNTTSISKLLPAFANAAGFDLSKVELHDASFATQMPSFLNGQADAVDGYIFGEWVQTVAEGKEANLFKWSDYGMKMYGSTILVNDDYLKKNPEVVERFVKATIQGFEYAIDNPNEVVPIIKKYTEVEEDLLQLQWEAAYEYFESEDTKQHGLGWMTEAKWEQTQETNIQYGIQTNRLPLEQLFDNSFVEKAVK